jgi:hypothetical protein
MCISFRASFIFFKAKLCHCLNSSTSVAVVTEYMKCRRCVGGGGGELTVDKVEPSDTARGIEGDVG